MDWVFWVRTAMSAGFVVFALILWLTPTRHGWRHMALAASSLLVAAVNQTVLAVSIRGLLPLAMVTFVTFLNIATVDWRTHDTAERDC